VSLRIKGGSSTVIIGRTGSGKTTLALAILAAIPLEAGRITIGDIDVSTVDKQTLRTRITFLAQDPILFPGTMRQNLDPLVEHSDNDCEAVLMKICGRHKWTLDTEIDTGGRNLSQGQRQLIGLARALLRRSPIVIFDEATASIDTETAVCIQRILRDEMRGSTVITIAHRAEAVKHADYCIVLGKGQVVQQGSTVDMPGYE
jgi:ABC-type multidrug transport system fused ATPase/permease subunit